MHSRRDTLTLAIGDIGIEIRCPRPALLKRLSHTYILYASQGPADFRLDLDYLRETDPGQADLPPSPATGMIPPQPPRRDPLRIADATPVVSQSGGETTIRRCDFLWRSDTRLKAMTGAFPKGSQSTAVESLLRISCAFAAVRSDGVLMHSAGVIRNGFAHIFPGKSGAGKTTIAGLAVSQDDVLSDELVLVRRTGHGYHVYSTPFHGTNPGRNSKLEAPLGAVLFPVKDTRASLRKIESSRALANLLSTVLFFGRNPALAQKLVDIGEDILSKHDAFAFHFPPDASIWTCVDQLHKLPSSSL